MKKLLLIFVLSIFVVSCNKSDISEQVKIPDWSNTNISVWEKWVNISTNSWEKVNSVTVWEKWVDIKALWKWWKQTKVSVGASWVKVNSTWNKTNKINVTSTWWVKVNSDSWVSTEEVDSLLRDIDKMIDSK